MSRNRPPPWSEAAYRPRSFRGSSIGRSVPCHTQAVGTHSLTHPRPSARDALAVPAGLDGNPNPLVTAARTEVLEQVATRALAETTTGSVLVAVDGASGTGKSTFADELARSLDGSGRAVVRASIDSFHNPRAVRYRLGSDSPEGYYRDSHDLRSLESELLQPFIEGNGLFRSAIFDEPTDRAIAPDRQQVPPQAVLVFDGLFLHRPALDRYWHLSVLLLAEGRCEAAWRAWLERGLPAGGADREAEIARRIAKARRHRYIAGQALYEAEAAPRGRADVVIDNDDLAAPVILRCP